MDAPNLVPAPDFRVLFEAVPGLCLVLAPNLRIVAATDAYLRATMTSREQILGRPMFDVFPDNPDDPAASGVYNLRDSLERVLCTGQPEAMAVQKYAIRRPQSEGGEFEERYWSPVNSPVFGPEGNVRYIIHKVEDVTEFVRLRRIDSEHDRVAEALRTRAGQMESEIYSRSQELGEANRQLRVVNERLARLYEQLAVMMPNEDGRVTRTPLPRDAAPHRLTPEETLERVAQLIAVRKNLEDQLRQSQKMEAVGRLAGGVAHDFNNLLTVIAGYAGFALEDVTDVGVRECLTEIEKAAERAGSLTKQLLAFSRKQVLQPCALDCNTVVAEMESMLRRLIGENISLVTVLGSGVAKIRADRSQLEQVILNLAVNARDAMPHGGRLVLETTTVQVDAGRVQSLGQGLYSVISVSDTGYGIDAATVERIFEPFFTTKEPGKGTGLGLSTVHGIVQQSGGAIAVDTVPGKGATFRVYLPAFDAAAEEQPSERSAHSVKPSLGEVMIVEDEAPLRNLVAQILRRAGYRVVEAASGEEALVLAQAHPVDLVLTDVVMPGITGPELAEKLRGGRSGLNVLFMSGYDRELLASKAAAEVNFLPKPFTPEALLAKVAESMGSGSRTRRGRGSSVA